MKIDSNTGKKLRWGAPLMRGGRWAVAVISYKDILRFKEIGFKKLEEDQEFELLNALYQSKYINQDGETI